MAIIGTKNTYEKRYQPVKVLFLSQRVCNLHSYMPLYLKSYKGEVILTVVLLLGCPSL